MKNITVILGLVLVLALLAGCVQSNNAKTTNSNTVTNITNQSNTAVINQNQTENITYENISNGTSINDTAEVGYLNSSETPF